MTVTDNRRVESLRVRLAPDMMDKFDALAARFGMPASTLAAFALAQFVQQEETKATVTKLTAIEAARRIVDKFDTFVTQDQIAEMVVSFADKINTEQVQGKAGA